MTAVDHTESSQILGRVLQNGTFASFGFISALKYALICAIQGKEEELGFHLRNGPEGVPAKTKTDLADFSDDISLASNTVEQACKLVVEVERHCKRIWFGHNAKKT